MSARLVGREVELAWIRTRMQPSRSEHPRLLLISGEAGIGKTHFLRESISEERIIASIRFPHSRFATPGFGLRHLADMPGPAASILRAELESSEEEPDAWRLLGIHRAADELVRAQTGGVILFDDLQWGDELTLGWLSQALGALRSSSTFILAGVRTVGHLPRQLDALMPALRAGEVDTLQLRPLSLAGIIELARSMGHSYDEELGSQLLSLTGGIPLAIREVLNELDRRGRSLSDLPRSERSLGTLPLIAGIVREQASELNPDALHVIAIACLIPQTASANTIRNVSRLPKSRFLAAVEDAADSGLVVVAQDGSLSFRHELQREAFQRQLPSEERQALHRRIAAVMSADPTFPAGPISHQLAEAGLVDEALEWLERAAKDSSRAHDHGNALTFLEAAIESCPIEDTETLSRLAEQAVVEARCCNQISRGIALVDSAIELGGISKARGRLLLCRGKLVSYAGDFRERSKVLKEARRELEGVNDKPRLARALGELAFPVGSSMTLQERIELGSAGLELAEEIRDSDAVALCAINLASSKFYVGDEDAFRLWARASSVLTENLPPNVLQNQFQGRAELKMRNYNNWSLASLSYGDFGQAREVFEAGIEACKVPYWESSFHCIRTLYLWRTGKWSEALDAAAQVEGAICRLQARAVAGAVKSAILFERESHPDTKPLEDATRALIEWSDEEFGAIAQSLLMRIRLARREPSPDRDLMSLVDLIITSGMRVGWEDLLPAVAEASPAVYRRIAELLRAQQVSSPRGLASRALAEGWMAAVEQREEAEALLSEAAERFQALPEPFPAARALERLGRLRSAQGKRSGETFRRAAEIYEGVGAERSLASLLRSVNNQTALQRFRFPPSQANSGAPGLTPRERDVADLARRGYSARQIGEELGIATATVKKHLEHIKDKLGYSRKSDLVRFLAKGI